jgi:hypothetical protein
MVGKGEQGRLGLTKGAGERWKSIQFSTTVNRLWQFNHFSKSRHSTVYGRDDQTNPRFWTLWIFQAIRSRITGEWGTGKDSEGSGGGPIEIRFQNLTEGTGKYHESLQSLSPAFRTKIYTDTSRIQAQNVTITPCCSVLPDNYSSEDK